MTDIETEHPRISEVDAHAGAQLARSVGAALKSGLGNAELGSERHCGLLRDIAFLETRAWCLETLRVAYGGL